MLNKKMEKIMKKTIFNIAVLFTAFTAFTALSAQDNTVNNTVQEKKDESALEINTRIQFRAVSGQKESVYAATKDYDAIDFNFRRIRITAKYDISKNYGGVIDIKGEKLLENGKSSIQEANIWFKPGTSLLKITMGQFKLPFLREQLTSGAKLAVTERSFSEGAVGQMDIGVRATIMPFELVSPFLAKKLVLDFSYTNGDGSGHDGVGYKQAETKSGPIGPLVNWRIEVNPLGGIVKDGKDKGWKDGDEIFQKDTLFSLGYAGLNTNSNEVASKFTPAKSLTGHTVDFTLFSMGAYLNGEYTIFKGDAAPYGYQTYQATAGYMIPVMDMYVMPVLRYNYLQADDLTKKNNKIDFNEKFTDIWVGTNIFVEKHTFKFQVFYQIKGDKAHKDSAGKLDNTDKKDNLIYFQAQTNFGKDI